jgi:hypothetical protein
MKKFQFPFTDIARRCPICGGRERSGVAKKEEKNPKIEKKLRLHEKREVRYSSKMYANRSITGTSTSTE